MIKKMLFLVLITCFVIISCDNEDEPKTTNLVLNLSGLEELGSDFVYEGWIIVDGEPVSTGVFSSVTFPQSFQVEARQLASATKFVLSIEPKVDTDLAPAATKILVGDFIGNTASVNSNGIVANFSSASGKYILATPTDEDNTNEASGVWFLDNSTGSAVAGLSLPTLSEGWKYEGWVVFNGTPISTGTFINVTGFDDNATTSPFKGIAGNGPNFPGEDYLRNAPTGLMFPTDLKGKTIVISVEPNPDNSPSPFALKPLAHVVPANAEIHTPIAMGAEPVTSLSGLVTR